MKTWHFFDAATGLFTGSSVSYPPGIPNIDDFVESKIPAGQKAIAADGIDHASMRVNIETGQVVDYQPPQPSPDHEWNATTKRWQLTEAARAAAVADQAARSAITAAEAGSDRVVREALLELLPKDSPARQKLQQLDDVIAAERPKIKKD
jgi:hypothetical protein